jgi:hypothetical protein
MSNTIIATSTKQINLSTKFFLIETDGTEIDIQGLMKANIDSEDAWVNINPILKKYNTRFPDWTRNKTVKEFINYATVDFFKCCTSATVKIPFPESQWYTKDKFSWLDNDCPLICTRKGRYHSGTWLHKTLFLEFLSVTDVAFRFEMHKLVSSIIATSKVVKINRIDTKFQFHPLADSIRDIYIPAQTSENAIKFAYSNFMDMVNLKVLGMKARKYREVYNLDPKTAVRDTLPKATLKEIAKYEEHVNGLMMYGGLTDIREINERLGGF